MNQQELEAKFLKTFNEYSDAIYRFCLVKVSNKEHAEDMTQEVFTRFWHTLREGKELTHTRAFIYTIASNLAKDWYKKKKTVSLDARLEEGFDPAAEGSATDIVARYNEVLGAIDDLEEKDREVLLLRHVEDIGPQEIAEIIGESANTVSVRLNRALKRLQQKLGV